MGREIWHTGGAVYGLEECVCTRGEQERAITGSGTGDAIWADVPAPGIRIIAANSPQAKGRVERNHGTHQDRLVKKMRRKKIRTHAEANMFLEKEYLPEHNRRFTRVPAHPEDYHRPTPRAAELNDAFHLERERVIG